VAKECSVTSAFLQALAHLSYSCVLPSVEDSQPGLPSCPGSGCTPAAGVAQPQQDCVTVVVTFHQNARLMEPQGQLQGVGGKNSWFEFAGHLRHLLTGVHVKDAQGTVITGRVAFGRIGADNVTGGRTLLLEKSPRISLSERRERSIVVNGLLLPGRNRAEPLSDFDGYK